MANKFRALFSQPTNVATLLFRHVIDEFFDSNWKNELCWWKNQSRQRQFVYKSPEKAGAKQPWRAVPITITINCTLH